MSTSICRLAFATTTLAVFASLAPVWAQTSVAELDAVVISAQQPVSLLVNGFPIYDWDPVPSGSVTYELNAYLKQSSNTLKLVFPRVDLSVPGTNTLVRLRIERQIPLATNETDLLFVERVLGRGTPPDLAPPLFETILVTNPISSRRQIESFVLSNQLTRASWDADVGTIQHAFISAAAPTNDEFSLSTSMPDALLSSLPWEGSPPVLSGSDQASITALVTNLFNAIRTNDDATIYNLLLSKVQRFAQARGTTDLVVSNALVAGFNLLRTATPPFVFDPLNPQTIQFVTYPGSALVETKVNGGPPIHAVSSTNEFSKRVFLSRIAGQWQIVD